MDLGDKVKSWCRRVVYAAITVSVWGCGGPGEGDDTSELTCTSPLSLCATECIDLRVDSGNCGNCGNPCAPGTACQNGACAPFCVQGEAQCGAICLGVQSDANNCGSCGNPCSSGLVCDRGTCSTTCSGLLCPTPSGASACAHTESDPDHCGACGNACPPGHECAEGSCKPACPTGLIRCEGVCIDPLTSSTHCGGCGVACPVGCNAGTCNAASCAPPQTSCGGGCVELASSIYHCGSCGTICAEGLVCSQGSCVCPGTQTLCGTTCVDITSDNDNCGACGTACSGGATCQLSACACAGNLELCGELCVDTAESSSHCGGCDLACESFESCVEGSCRFTDGDNCAGDASGIDLTRLALYQAVEIELFQEGRVVPREERTVDIVQGKDALVRGFVTPKSDFTPRQLSLRLFVTNGEETKVLYHSRRVTSVSAQSSLASTFQIEVPADLLNDQTTFRAELVECENVSPQQSASITVLPPPPEGELALEARITGPLKVTFVPVEHDGLLPDTSEATLRAYADAVRAEYPTTEVITALATSIRSEQTGATIDLPRILDLIRQKRTADRVAQDVYYYGLIRPTETFNQYCRGTCTTGVAFVLESTEPYTISSRAGIGIGFANRISAETFVHELGHNHGREHAPCGVNGDPNFPYPQAGTGIWGYDPASATLKDPAMTKDFMSYCDPPWVSDYTYRALLERVAAVNRANSTQNREWAGEAPRTWWAMHVSETGVRWTQGTTTEGPLSALELGVVYDKAGAPLLEVEVFRVKMSEGAGYLLFVPPPEPGWAAVGLPGGPILGY